jgi:hypothetical protein
MEPTMSAIGLTVRPPERWPLMNDRAQLGSVGLLKLSSEMDEQREVWW